MHIATLVLCLALGQSGSLDNLGFEKGQLSGWTGSGFYVTGADPRGPSPLFAVCSSDAGSKQRTGELRRSFVVPPGARTLKVNAHAVYGKGATRDGRLNVLLLRDDTQPVQKKVRNGQFILTETGLLGRLKGKSREYAWDLAEHVGQTLHLVLLDQDDRPGCYLFCADFRLEAPGGGSVAAREETKTPVNPVSYKTFAAEMVNLQKIHKLSPMSRYDSKRFLALSNASETFTSDRLRYCETFCDQFYTHFQRFGFQIAPPTEKLMIAVFDSHPGFEAYLGRKMPFGVTGIYHPGTNRLVIYDLREDPTLLASKKNALKQDDIMLKLFNKKAPAASTIERQFNDLAHDINLSTIMHEAAHQLSFNGGMLNRHGDIPIWLAEGLATYCEATEDGDWTTLGSPNPGRIDTLRKAAKVNRLIPLAELIRGDGWLNMAPLPGYAGSWALFHMLLHERPQALRKYLASIHDRRAPDHRMPDFVEAFGDFQVLEVRYRSYIANLIDTVPAPKVR